MREAGACIEKQELVCTHAYKETHEFINCTVKLFTDFLITPLTIGISVVVDALLVHAVSHFHYLKQQSKK